jgi:hypothetical protein
MHALCIVSSSHHTTKTNFHVSTPNRGKVNVSHLALLTARNCPTIGAIGDEQATHPHCWIDIGRSQQTRTVFFDFFPPAPCSAGSMFRRLHVPPATKVWCTPDQVGGAQNQGGEWRQTGEMDLVDTPIRAFKKKSTPLKLGPHSTASTLSLTTFTSPVLSVIV